MQKSGHQVHIYSQHKAVNSILHQAITDEDLLSVTYHLDNLPSNRFAKIFTLIKKASSNIFNPNTYSLLKGLFGNVSTLSPYNYITFLDKPGYDVLHAHFGSNGNYVTELRKLGLYKNAKFITTFHGYDLDYSYKANDYYLSLFNSCNTFTVNSLYSKNELIRLGCDENKIHLLPVGLDIDKFKPIIEKTASPNFLKLLFVGRLIGFKAPDRVIEICRLLKLNNRVKFKASIIGDGPMLSELKELANKYGLSNEIVFEGSKTQEQIITAMETSDLFLYPGITFKNRAENQGLVIQEAQAMSLPVLVSDAGGMSEGVLNGLTGFVIPEDDLVEFANKVELLAQDICLRKRMGGRGRQLVKDKYDINVLNKQLLNLYKN